MSALPRGLPTGGSSTLGGIMSRGLPGGAGLPGQRPGGLARAFIELEGGKRLPCLFNPNKYRIARANTWNESPRVGKNLPELQFGGGQARKMSFELLFDDSDKLTGDVGRITDELFGAMDVRESHEPGKNAARPPTVTFGWGGTRTFKAVIEQLSIEFVLFRPDGVPVRAIAQIELRQADNIVGATSGATAGNADGGMSSGADAAGAVGTHTLREGDSLQSIANDAYGDPAMWRTVAEANGIDNPMNLLSGSVLTVPPSVKAFADEAGAARDRAQRLLGAVESVRGQVANVRSQVRSLPGGGR